MPADTSLAPLWGNRENLTEAEWEELYKLVFSIFKRRNPSIMRSLPESTEHYIQDFF
jgi:hypothetical protein